MGKYAAAGTGLADPRTRKNLYTAAIVVAAIVVATLVTLGIITRDQITEFIALLGWAVGILAGVLGIVTAALARGNVEPPHEEPGPRTPLDEL